MFQFVQFVPDLPLEDGLGSDSEAITAYEICLAFIAEIWIGLQEVLKLIFPWLELTVFVFEHANGAACVDDEHLTHMTDTSICAKKYLSIFGLMKGFCVFAGSDDLFVVIDFARNLKC